MCPAATSGFTHLQHQPYQALFLTCCREQEGRGEGGKLFPQADCGSSTVPCCYSSSVFLSGYFKEASLSTTSVPSLPPQMALPPTPTSYHNILYLRGAQPVPADVNDVIQPSCQLVVALTGTIHTIPSEEKSCSGQNCAMVTCCSKHVSCSPPVPSPHPLSSLSIGTRAHVLGSFLSCSGVKVPTFLVSLLPLLVPAPSSGSFPHSAVCWLVAGLPHHLKPAALCSSAGACGPAASPLFFTSRHTHSWACSLPLDGVTEANRVCKRCTNGPLCARGDSGQKGKHTALKPHVIQWERWVRETHSQGRAEVSGMGR